MLPSYRTVTPRQVGFTGRRVGEADGCSFSPDSTVSLDLLPVPSIGILKPNKRRLRGSRQGGIFMKPVRLIAFPILALGLSVVWAPCAAPAATHTVNPGDSIQAAIDSAAAGDTVKVMPGDYVGVVAGSSAAAIRITKPIKLVAKSNPAKGKRVRILPAVGLNHGILVEPANPGDPDVDGVTIKGFTVQGFPKNGIWLRHVKNFKIQSNESIDNLENGIWPTLSANGSVKKNVAYGSEDSALWIEASENVRVLKNEFYNSPTGLEITISKDVTVMKNDIHHNTIGIGLYHPSAAGLPLSEAPDFLGNWKISGNYVHDNNQPNAAPPGSMSAALPSGGGILVLGVDNVDVSKNRIENNNFFGIAMIDYCIAVGGTSFDCTLNIPEVETSPDNNRFTSNALFGNGGDPEPGPFAPFASDILALGGTNNCFSNNTATLTIPFPLTPEC
ncbi:MAG: right-handed parallel beta-helix repeat-containing protein [Betaproteobacteria bacterium]